MPSALILLLYVAAIALLLRLDIKRRLGVSSASWLVLLWVIIIGSRPVSTWVGYTAPVGVDAYVEGNPFERSVYLVLLIAAGLVLLRRGMNGRFVFFPNVGLWLLYGFWGVSLIWADDSFIAFKRLFKDFGNVIMVFLLLTESNPFEAIKAVFVRSSYLLVPLSVLFIKYFPDLGRTFVGYNSSDQMFVGVCTHKNTLGCLLVVSSIFLAWDAYSLLHDRSQHTQKARVPVVVTHGVVFAMAVWLLSIIDSATSLVSAAFAVGFFAFAQISWFRTRLAHLGVILLGSSVLFWGLDALFHLRNNLLMLLGREPTLTGRTDAWDLVIQHVDNPLLGAGFKSFWSGERMASMWQSFNGVVQAHSGYIETFANGGFVALALLGFWLLSCFHKMKATCSSDPVFGGVRLAVLLVSLLYNWTEATFHQSNILWFALLVVAVDLPRQTRVSTDTASA